MLPLLIICLNRASILSNALCIVFSWCLRSNATNPYFESISSASMRLYSAIVMSRYVADSVLFMMFMSSVFAASACRRCCGLFFVFIAIDD